MILVIVSFVGVEGICHFAVIDYTVSPALTVWILVLFIRPTAGSDCIAKLTQLARLFTLSRSYVYVHSCTLPLRCRFPTCFQYRRPRFASACLWACETETEGC